MAKHRSACPLDCPDLCGLEVTVEDGRVTQVDGDRRGPITDGFICGKVRKIANHLYGDDRVLRPLIRTGPKGGAPRWRESTWDEAIELVASRLERIVATSGGEAVLPYHYGGSNGYLTEGALATRFFRALGASRLERTFCASATTAATRGLFGTMPGVALEDYEHANLIVLWGVNPSATSIHLVPVIERARARGAKLVVVDPRTTPLAKRADLHLAVAPGGDLPLALAIANQLGASAFAREHAAEVDEFLARAAPWTLERAAAASGVDAATIARFVELYRASAPAVIRLGWGMERNRNGGSAVAAVLALPVLAGKLGVRGGGYTMSNGDAKWTLNADAAVGEPIRETRVVNMSQLSLALHELRAPRIEALFVYNCNPIATAPDQARLVAELARDDLFVVVHEQVMTDTAALADVVLPATAFLEHRDIRRGYGTMRLYDSPAVVAPPGEARSNNQLFGALLERMGLGAAESDEALATTIFASSPHGAAMRAQLAADGVAQPVGGDRPIPFVDAFPSTPDRKIHLVPAALDREAAAANGTGLYHVVADPGTASFPLALISPAMATQISSTFGQLRDAPAELELSLEDARARSIADRDRVRVWNERGEVHTIARVTSHVRPGVCVLAKGFWRKHTANGFTANALIPPGLADLGGQAAFNDARVQVAKL